MADEYLGKLLAGKYRVDSLLASHVYFDLYTGTNTALDTRITIKILERPFAKSKELFFNEARKLSRLSNPALPAVNDVGSEPDGTVFVVYEGVEGRSLVEEISEVGRFEIDRAISVGRHTAAALAAVYPSLPSYGSVDPASIIIDSSSDSPKIFNFISSSELSRKNEYTGDIFAIKGNTSAAANFSSPEALRAETLDERSDVYSLGSLLFVMLAGEMPFGDPPLPELIKKVLEDPPSPLSSFRSDLPDDLERVILTAMSKNPEMRFQTISEFSNELERFVSVTPTAAVVPAEAPKHEIWKTAFVVLAGVSLLTVALIYATSVKRTDPSTQLMPDANGQPVQPINPATGAQEQNLASMPVTGIDAASNSNSGLPPGTLPGGDGYDPWKNGGQPPPGAPPIQRGGQIVTIDPNNPSPFMTNDGPCIPQPSGILLCPAPITNKAVKPTPTPKPNSANSSVQPAATPTPRVNPDVKPTPEKPSTRPTPKSQTGSPSGKPKNGDDEF